MKLALRILLPLLIVGGTVWLAWYFIATKPEPKTFSRPEKVTRVEATRLVPETHQVFLETQGTVRPRTTSTLIPEVSGRIIGVSPNFREGGFFEKGEPLLTIDPVNYETALVVAESAVAEAKRALAEEKTRAQQARQNWERLGKPGEPSGLAAREPQLAEARARLRAAEAEAERARRDLERTEVKAPFAGRILEQNVDVGQVVSTGTELGRAFATDVMEVRLPLTDRQLSFVDLPERFRDEGKEAAEEGPKVFLTSDRGRNSGRWNGRIVRVESAIDEASRQLFVVARIRDPYRRREGAEGIPPKIGMFLDARVKGVRLEDVFVLPRRAVRVGGEVIVIDEDDRISRRRVDPVRSDEDEVVVPAGEGGLEAGELVCLTPLAYPANGARVDPFIEGASPDLEPLGQGPGRRGAGSPEGRSPDGEPAAAKRGGSKRRPGRGDRPDGEEVGGEEPRRS